MPYVSNNFIASETKAYFQGYLYSWGQSFVLNLHTIISSQQMNPYLRKYKKNEYILQSNRKMLFDHVILNIIRIFLPEHTYY